MAQSHSGCLHASFILLLGCVYNSCTYVSKFIVVASWMHFSFRVHAVRSGFSHKYDSSHFLFLFYWKKRKYCHYYMSLHILVLFDSNSSRFDSNSLSMTWNLIAHRQTSVQIHKDFPCDLNWICYLAYLQVILGARRHNFDNASHLSMARVHLIVDKPKKWIIIFLTLCSVYYVSTLI